MICHFFQYTRKIPVKIDLTVENKILRQLVGVKNDQSGKECLLLQCYGPLWFRLFRQPPFFSILYSYAHGPEVKKKIKC